MYDSYGNSMDVEVIYHATRPSNARISLKLTGLYYRARMST